ncbi:hypothetical protein BC833DRAFT_596218 [Globomyces pollinis-pini]|nr:hypothetical protein BC833DRAFT_596218 [Globomyces pollinis-pini]
MSSYHKVTRNWEKVQCRNVLKEQNCSVNASTNRIRYNHSNIMIHESQRQSSSTCDQRNCFKSPKHYQIDHTSVKSPDDSLKKVNLRHFSIHKPPRQQHSPKCSLSSLSKVCDMILNGSNPMDLGHFTKSVSSSFPVKYMIHPENPDLELKWAG